MSDTIQAFDFSVNLLQAIIWQYGTSQPNIQALITQKQNWYNENQQSFWEDWLTDVFDLRTCNQFGMVVWAIILGIPINYIIASTGFVVPWGFDTTNLTNFDGQSNFAVSGQNDVGYTLAEQRIILQLRYRQLTCRPDVLSINKIFADILVPVYGPMWVYDGGNMTISINCYFASNSFISAIVNTLQLIPKATGVSIANLTFLL